MGTNCDPLVADFFFFFFFFFVVVVFFFFFFLLIKIFHESDDNQAVIIEAFNSTSRYLNDLLNIDNPYLKGMVNTIYPP